jgi:hypothetical protein
MSSRTRVHVIAAVAIMASAPAFAGGTPEQRDACMPDALRLCSAAIPDEARVEHCLREAAPQLSAPCHAVFYPAAAAGAEPIQTARRQGVSMGR